MTVAAVAVVVLAVLAMVVVASYNRFVSQRQYVENSWSTVETELQRRYELIPNLVATVAGYAAHERETFEAVTQARAEAVDDRGTPEHQADTEDTLVGALSRLMAVTEAYPELKADEHFADLQHQLVVTEDRIQAARRLFNRNVREYNTRVEQIPTNLVARVGGFERAEYVEIDPVQAEVPSAAV
ncbi:MAG: LemA family protein [Actinomycetota bacterium]